MTPLSVAFIIFVLLLMGGGGYYFYYQQKYLGNKLELKVETESPSTPLGGNLTVILKGRATENITASRAGGSLVCKRFEGYKGDWRDKMKDGFLSRGEELIEVQYGLGKDLVFPREHQVSFPFRIPVPKEGQVTDTGGMVQFRWFLTAEVSLDGMFPVSVTEEIMVTQPGVKGISPTSETAQDHSEMVNFMLKSSHKGARDVIMVFDAPQGKKSSEINDGNKGEPHHKIPGKEKDQSRFTFLELGDD